MDAKSNFARYIRRAVILLAWLYVVLVIVLSFFQRRLIYFPTKITPAEAKSWALGTQLEPWDNSRGESIGWKRLSKGTPSAGQVLILHGNAGCALDWAGHANGLQNSEPLDVYILEYPGYGSRSGTPTQQSLVAAAEQALAQLDSHRAIYVVGESLGTGVAAFLAGAHPAAVAGIFLVAPYDNLSNVAREHMPMFPVKWILKDTYPSDQSLKSYHGPVGVLLAGKDTVVPSSLGRKLFNNYPDRKKLWEYPDATHDDVHSPKASLWREVIDFWRASN